MPILRSSSDEGPGPQAPEPPRLLRWFSRYVDFYLKRHFHSVRRSLGGEVPMVGKEPLIVYLNHPSWWDPLIGIHLCRRYFWHRQHRAVIDAEAVSRYRFFERLGFVGIERGSRRGVRRFLRLAEELEATPFATLWLTPQGEFVDARCRPVQLEPGLGHLAARLGRGVVLPLALEYCFWEERLPEALVRFGEPLDLAGLPGRSPAALSALLEARLETAQNALAAEALERERSAFEVSMGGRAGVGGVYDLWRRLRCWASGERFRPEHGRAEPRPSAEADVVAGGGVLARSNRTLNGRSQPSDAAKSQAATSFETSAR